MLLHPCTQLNIPPCSLAYLSLIRCDDNTYTLDYVSTFTSFKDRKATTEEPAIVDKMETIQTAPPAEKKSKRKRKASVGAKWFWTSKTSKRILWWEGGWSLLLSVCFKPSLCLACCVPCKQLRLVSGYQTLKGFLLLLLPSSFLLSASLSLLTLLPFTAVAVVLFLFRRLRLDGIGFRCSIQLPLFASNGSGCWGFFRLLFFGLRGG